MLKNIILVALGGALGSVARYLLSMLIYARFAMAFPLGTFIVNVLGCLIIGFVYGLAGSRTGLDNDVRLFLTVGLCGGFTTFSTFSNECLELLKNESVGIFVVYACLSVALGIFAAYGGYYLSRFFD